MWAKTVFILSYDENDGLFDHVVPPTPPAGTPDEFVFKTSNTGEHGGGLPIGLGFRVPCIIVSPWTVGGYVCSEVSDHTSQLQLPGAHHRRQGDQHQRVAPGDLSAT